MKKHNLDSSRRFSFNMRWIRWAGTILSSGLFIWLLTRQDWHKLWVTVSSISVWIIPLVFVLYFLGILGNALRWYLLLRAQEIKISYWEVLRIVLIGNFASNFLPSTVGGDKVRIVSAARFAGWALSVASGGVGLFLNLLVMFTLLPFSWFALGMEGSLGIASLSWSKYDGVHFSGGLLAGLFEKFRVSMMNWLKKLYTAMMVWRHRLDAVFLAFLVSWGARALVFYAVWLLARGLGMQVTLWQVIGVGALTNVLSVLPISINGLGLREVTMTALYTQIGASLEQASALVVVTRFILMIETLPGALWISDMLATKDAERAAESE